MNNKTMKTMIVAATVVMCAGTCFARGGGPRGGGPRGGGFRGGPAPVMRSGGHHHHHSGGVWGRGGRNFWPSFVGGVVGGILTDTIIAPAPVVRPAPVVVAPPPVVVTPPPAPVVVAPTPVYTTQNVWVEGRYVDQVQPNGVVVRVWQPGHYEQRQVRVQ